MKPEIFCTTGKKERKAIKISHWGLFECIWFKEPAIGRDYTFLVSLYIAKCVPLYLAQSRHIISIRWLNEHLGGILKVFGFILLRFGQSYQYRSKESVFSLLFLAFGLFRSFLYFCSTMFAPLDWNMYWPLYFSLHSHSWNFTCVSQVQCWAYGFCSKNISWAMFTTAILESKSNNYSASTILTLHKGLTVDDLIAEDWWQTQGCSQGDHWS